MTLDLKAIREQADAATPGPWICADVDVGVEQGNETNTVASCDIDLCDADVRRNAAFIASARADVPALCDEVERSRAALAAAPKLWTCERCAFAFDARHVCEDGQYRCSNCGEGEMQRERDEARADAERLARERDDERTGRLIARAFRQQETDRARLLENERDRLLRERDEARAHADRQASVLDRIDTLVYGESNDERDEDDIVERVRVAVQSASERDRFRDEAKQVVLGAIDDTLAKSVTREAEARRELGEAREAIRFLAMFYGSEPDWPKDNPAINAALVWPAENGARP